MIQKYPDQIMDMNGHLIVQMLIDTVKRDSIAVPDALKIYEVLHKRIL